MRRPLAALLLLAISTATFANDVVLRFGSQREGQAILGKLDEYASQTSAYERQAKLKLDRPLSAAAFSAAQGNEVQDWDKAELQRLLPMLARIHNDVAAFKLKPPGEIMLFKTSGREEGNAAYTRGNGIFLSSSDVGKPDRELEDEIRHELFHVLSRHDRQLRERAYAIIGYTPCPLLSVPPEIEASRISNPDEPRNASYCIELTIDGHSARYTPMLFSTLGHIPKGKENFFDGLVMRLLQVSTSDGRSTAVRDGKALQLIDPEQTPAFLKKTGMNTGYLIHPEETMADNFVFASHRNTSVPSPWVVEQLLKVLQ
ncbi:hypothetical protein SAMN02745857_01973 [Andreprevotia lacus DSM 23236]|jgi:hypothetical protein|uniref:DUF4157 domain-containing protein n=1 Tax=Andreprevotia lacus DSM 23236 TaxID=1121001 RepID=A0A1W1XLV4_9NEIS|nr:hypothetical protein [Andreprevotia lacus]SMC24824.1 hypothetical protein SAMN02745857_01973 [Andreprevotia lacus DSM 23236]